MKNIRINYKLLTLVLLLISSYGCNSQSKYSFSYENVSSRSIVRNSNFRLRSDYVDITNYLPKGYVTNGTVDYTQYIQKGIDENTNIKMPNFPIKINDTGLNLKSNSVIYFQSKSKLIKSASALKKYQLININNLDNVILINPTLYGDRMVHKSKDGEWGMGISIISSTNINIINSDIRNFWGDGIYISRLGTSNSNNILIDGGIIDNNRRNGISIINGNNINIKNLIVSNTNGTLPMAGIDIEPNSNSDNINNVVVANVKSINNAQTGFLLFFESMLGNLDKNINISFINCSDKGSEHAISIPGLRNDYKSTVRKLKGNIVFKNFKSYDSKVIFSKSSGNYVYTPNINFYSMKQYKNNSRDYNSEAYFSKWIGKRNIKLN